MTGLWIQLEHLATATVRHPDRTVWRSQCNVPTSTFGAIVFSRHAPFAELLGLGIKFYESAALEETWYPRIPIFIDFDREKPFWISNTQEWKSPGRSYSVTITRVAWPFGRENA